MEEDFSNKIDALLVPCKKHDSEQMIKMIRNKYKNDYNLGLYTACIAGNLKIAQIMINKGAKGYGEALYHTCKSSNKKLFELLISKLNGNWTLGLKMALESENQKSIKKKKFLIFLIFLNSFIFLSPLNSPQQ